MNFTTRIVADCLNEATTFAVYKDQQAARSQHALTCVSIFWALVKQSCLTGDDASRIAFLLKCGLSHEDIEAL